MDSLEVLLWNSRRLETFIRVLGQDPTTNLHSTAMYTRPARSAACSLTSRSNSRNYATRRIIKDTPSIPLPARASSFPFTDHFPKQPAYFEATICREMSERGSTENSSLYTGFQKSHLLGFEKRIPKGAISLALSNGEEVHAAYAHSSIPQNPVVELNHRNTNLDREPYWQRIGRWKDVTEKEFLSHRWQVSIHTL